MLEDHEYDPKAIIQAMRDEYFQSLEEEEDTQRLQDSLSILGFRLGDENFAITIKELKSVIRVPRYTSLPLSPVHLLGIINVRGEIRPVLDLHPVFGLPSSSDGKSARILIIHENVRSVSLLVDEILDLYEIYTDEIKPPLHVQTRIPPTFLKGKVEIQSKLVLLLDLPALLNSEELSIRTR